MLAVLAVSATAAFCGRFTAKMTAHYYIRPRRNAIRVTGLGLIYIARVPRWAPGREKRGSQGQGVREQNKTNVPPLYVINLMH